MDKIIYLPTFLTATIKDGKPLLKPDKYKIIVLKNLKQLVDEDEITLYAYCIMHNHIHIVWQIKDDISISEVQKDFFESTAKKIKKDLEIHHPEVLKLFISTQKDRGYHFWKRRQYNFNITQLSMDKIIYLPTFLTATIKDGKTLLKTDKYKITVLKKLNSW